jgi:hypothetical protein
MEFIEISGKTLLKIVHDNEPFAPLSPDELAEAGVTESSILRVNRQGDIELRRPEGWDVIGGLLGEYEDRLRHETGLDWA